MSPPDARIEAIHRAQAPIILRDRRRDTVDNTVRRSLIDQCKQPGTRAYDWLTEYRADNDCDITAVAFIDLAERGDWDLWRDAMNRAGWLEARGRIDDRGGM